MFLLVVYLGVVMFVTDKKINEVTSFATGTNIEMLEMDCQPMREQNQ